MSKHNYWKELLKLLRKNFPIERSVSVHRLKILKNNGVTTFKDNSFIIYINSEQSSEGQIDSLLHEWAHVRAIDEACQHKGRWGELHGEIYEIWEKWDNEE